MKKLIALMLAVVCAFSMLTLTSCQSGSKGKVLTIGVDDTYPPMEFKGSGSTADQGFDVDLANEMGKRMGMTVKFQSTAWDGIFTALNSKKYDCIVSSVSITEERQKNYIFTKPYIANAQEIIVKKGDTSIKTQSDLKGKKVGCQVGTTANDSATTLIKSGTTMTLTTYDQIIQCFQAMNSGKIQAIIVDEVVGEYYVAKSPDKYETAAPKLTNEPIGICFRKSDTALRDSAQKTIDAMTADGTMKKLSIKWFGKDLTSNIDTKLKML